MAKKVAEVGDLRILYYLFRHLRRNEEHAAVAPQHHVARHYRRLADPDRRY